MNQDDLRKRQERAETELLVISKTEDGYKVYSPASSGKHHLVTLDADAPKCSCPDFELHQAEPRWRCKHILAVQNQLAKQKPTGQEPDPYDAEERRAIQEESRTPEKPRKRETKTRGNGTSQMVIKRSISPDGHIDSLSVELSYPVGKAPPEEIKKRADEALRIQSEIVNGFRATNGKETKGMRQPEAKVEDPDGAVPAQMLGVGGMPGQWGRRLFINVHVNGQISKLFGKREQLAEHIVAAGFSSLVGRIEEGFQLNLPCRVITKPSKDGRFTNIERVLPIQPGPEGRAPR